MHPYDAPTLTSADDSEWWHCPECGGDTRVCRGPNVPAERECVECGWSVTIPVAPEEVDRWA